MFGTIIQLSAELHKPGTQTDTMKTVDEASASSSACNQGDNNSTGKMVRSLLISSCYFDVVRQSGVSPSLRQRRIICVIKYAVTLSEQSIQTVCCSFHPEIILSLCRACGCTSPTGIFFLSPHAFLNTALYFDNISLFIRAGTELLSGVAL